MPQADFLFLFLEGNEYILLISIEMVQATSDGISPIYFRDKKKESKVPLSRWWARQLPYHMKKTIQKNIYYPRYRKIKF